jgi:hypothetical protein
MVNELSQYSSSVNIGIMSREKDGLLTDKPPETTSGKSNWPLGRIAGVSVVGKVVQEVCSMIDQPI